MPKTTSGSNEKDQTTSGTQMVWDLAGRPTVGIPEPAAGECAICGNPTAETLPSTTVLGPNYTEQYLLARRDTTRVCIPCAWVCSGKPPTTLRMWTVLARPDITVPPSHPKAPTGGQHLHLTGRNDMRAVVNTLTFPPPGRWLVSIAESGKKHHVPYAQVNQGNTRWTVRMDTINVTATPQQFRHLLTHVLPLRAAGFSAAQIETVTPGRLTAETLPIWQHHAEPLVAWRNSALLHLTVYLPNKEHMDEYLRTYAA